MLAPAQASLSTPDVHPSHLLCDTLLPWGTKPNADFFQLLCTGFQDPPLSGKS